LQKHCDETEIVTAFWDEKVGKRFFSFLTRTDARRTGSWADRPSFHRGRGGQGENLWQITMCKKLGQGVPRPRNELHVDAPPSRIPKNDGALLPSVSTSGRLIPPRLCLPSRGVSLPFGQFSPILPNNRPSSGTKQRQAPVWHDRQPQSLGAVGLTEKRHCREAPPGWVFEGSLCFRSSTTTRYSRTISHIYFGSHKRSTRVPRIRQCEWRQIRSGNAVYFETGFDFCLRRAFISQIGPGFAITGAHHPAGTVCPQNPWRTCTSGNSSHDGPVVGTWPVAHPPAWGKPTRETLFFAVQVICRP